MRLKELITTMETFQTDAKTGLQVIGERPEIPLTFDEDHADVVLYIGMDMTDRKLLKTARIAFHQYGNIPVVRRGVVEVPVEIEKIVEVEKIVEKIVEVPVESEKVPESGVDLDAMVQEIKDLKAELAKTKRALTIAKKAAGKDANTSDEE